jgi:cephalosporin-C deacetylase-like acetyl esterase
LLQDESIDKERIIVYGHSRNGKTALLCGAFDERVAAVIPHQAGCGGTSPARGKTGEQLRDINKNFPHWFNDTYVQFNEHVERLPFDQHCLIAMCAPRPVLLTNAVEDQWANPVGQFENLQAADEVYRFLGAPGLEAQAMPKPGEPVLSHLGYFIREGQHSVTEEDWKVFLDFADAQLKE